MQGDDLDAETAEHALDLVIATFDQGQVGMVVVQQLQLRRLGEVEAFGKGRDQVPGDDLGGGDPVALGLLVARMTQAA